MSANPVARPQSRRAFIGALAALPVAAAAPAEAARPDPVLALIEEADRLYQQTGTDLVADWGGLGQNTFDEWHDALNRLFSTPATTTAGLAAQLEAYWRTWCTKYGHEEPDMEDAQVRHLRALIDAVAVTAGAVPARSVAAPTRQPAPSDPVDPADADLVRWLDLCSAFNIRMATPSAVEDKTQWAAIQAAEDTLIRGEPSTMRAAGIFLYEMIYFGDVADDYRMAARVLRGLRPQLSGAIGRFASDIIDHPNRAFGESLISRAYGGA